MSEFVVCVSYEQAFAGASSGRRLGRHPLLPAGLEFMAKTTLHPAAPRDQSEPDAVQIKGFVIVGGYVAFTGAG